MTKEFPKGEIYGITSQIRRASYSIPSNVAEGSEAEFKRFLVISRGSASELEYFTILAKDLGYIEQSIFEELNDKVDKVRRSLSNLINKV